MSKIITGECLEELKKLPDESVNCIITSPPYYGLRDYGTGHWVGGDPNCPHKRLSKYSHSCTTGHSQIELAGNVGDAIYKHRCPLCGAIRVDDQIGLEETPDDYANKLVKVFHECKRILKTDGTFWLNIGDTYAVTESKDQEEGSRRDSFYGKPKPKDMIGIPWMVAFALRKDGWYLRQDIIWEKTNPMPEPVKDRCTKSHEYIFLFSKSEKYYFDEPAIKEQATSSAYSLRHKRDVWKVATTPIKEAHFATFPVNLIQPMILAGTEPNGIVLDPFFGSGTVGVVSEMYGRQFIGIELKPEYVKIAQERLRGVQGKLNL